MCGKRRLLLFALIVCLVALVGWILPYYLPARVVSARHACMGNLEYLQRLKKDWAAKNKKNGNDTPTEQDLFGKEWVQKMSKCPVGGDYRLGAVKEHPVCSIGGPGHSLPARQ
jgi:hypothetical protein